MHKLVDSAAEAGFDVSFVDEMRGLVLSYSDVFRLRLGRDEPADVKAFYVRLMDDA